MKSCLISGFLLFVFSFDTDANSYNHSPIERFDTKPMSLLEFVKLIFPSDLSQSNAIFLRIENAIVERKMMMADSVSKKDKAYLENQYAIMPGNQEYTVNNKMENLVRRINRLIGADYKLQPYTKIWINGKLSEEYDTSKYKYLICHTWTTGMISPTYMGNGSWSAGGARTDILQFHFYDMQNNVHYQTYDSYEEYYEDQLPLGYYEDQLPLSYYEFFKDLYKFISISNEKGSDRGFDYLAKRQRGF